MRAACAALLLVIAGCGGAPPAATGGPPRRVVSLAPSTTEILFALAGAPARSVLLVVGHSPLIVAGAGTLQDELVTIAGGKNVVADVGQAWPHVSLELVVARAPEVILDAAMGTERGGRKLFEGLTTVPAVRTGRIVPLAPDALFRAGPRVTEAAAALAAAIHPERFGAAAG